MKRRVASLSMMLILVLLMTTAFVGCQGANNQINETKESRFPEATHSALNYSIYNAESLSLEQLSEMKVLLKSTQSLIVIRNIERLDDNAILKIGDELQMWISSPIDRTPNATTVFALYYGGRINHAYELTTSEIGFAELTDKALLQRIKADLDDFAYKSAVLDQGELLTDIQPSATTPKPSFFQIYYYGDEFVLIEDAALADNLIAAIDAGPELLPASYSFLHAPIVKVYQNNELVKEISLGCSEGIFYAKNNDSRESGYYLQPPYSLPAEITQQLEAYMMDHYLTIRTWDCQMHGGPVIAADRIQSMTLSNLADKHEVTYQINDQGAETIQQLVDLYNQSNEVPPERFSADYSDMPQMSDSEKAIWSGQNFSPVFSTEIKFANGDRLQVQTGALRGVHKLTLHYAGGTIEKTLWNQELSYYLEELSGRKSDQPQGQYLRVITAWGEVLIDDPTLAADVNAAILELADKPGSSFKLSTTVALEVKEDQKVLHRMVLSGKYHEESDATEYLVWLFNGVNTIIPVELGERIEAKVQQQGLTVISVG